MIITGRATCMLISHRYSESPMEKSTAVQPTVNLTYLYDFEIHLQRAVCIKSGSRLMTSFIFQRSIPSHRCCRKRPCLSIDPTLPDINAWHHSLASIATSDTATLRLRDVNQSALTMTAERAGLKNGGSSLIEVEMFAGDPVEVASKICEISWRV